MIHNKIVTQIPVLVNSNNISFLPQRKFSYFPRKRRYFLAIVLYIRCLSPALDAKIPPECHTPEGFSYTHFNSEISFAMGQPFWKVQQP